MGDQVGSSPMEMGGEDKEGAAAFMAPSSLYPPGDQG